MNRTPADAVKLIRLAATGSMPPGVTIEYLERLQRELLAWSDRIDEELSALRVREREGRRP